MSEISKLTADDCIKLANDAESDLMVELLNYVYKDLNKLRKKRVKKFLDYASEIDKPIQTVDGLLTFLNNVDNKEILERLFKANVDISVRDVKEFLKMFNKQLSSKCVYRELI